MGTLGQFLANTPLAYWAQVKVNFASAPDFDYICASRTYTDALRQNQSKLCFCSQLFVYLHQPSINGMENCVWT